MNDTKYSVIDHHSIWGWPKQNTSPEEAEIIFTWNDFTMEEDVKKWQSKGKKVIVFEHGWNAIFDYENNNHDLIADGYMVLGQSGAESLIRKGLDRNKILVCGNPNFDITNRKDSNQNIVPKILYTALHWVRDMTDFNNNLFKNVLETFEPYAYLEVKTNNKSNINIPENIPNWRSEINSNFNLFEDIKTKVNEYDIILTPKESTFDFLAILSGKRVFRIAEEKDYRKDNEPKIRNILPFTPLEPEIINKPMNLLVDINNELTREKFNIEEIIKWVQTL